MSYIRAESLVKRYGNDGAGVTAVGGISFEIEPAEFVAVMGESGSGKSTLLLMMGGLNEPTSGRYSVDDIEVYALEQDRRADFRREFVGFVFQDFHLVPYLTVVENVLLPLVSVKESRREKRARAEDALHRVGLVGKGERLPGQISGGEQERVAVARAIVNEAPILLADEPTGNLDTKTSGEIMDLLQTLNRDGVTIVMVTHSHQCAAYADRIMQLSDGRLQRWGRPERHAAASVAA